jgi:DNA-binding response OmpR family regulator
VPPAVRRATVLVVEDDADLRRLYRMALMMEGYAVIAVEDGIDALRRIDEDSPSIIVLDIALPRLSGHEVQKELAAHEETRHIPIVVVSGDTGDLNPDDFDCVLRKPVSPDALLDAITDCLRRVRGKRHGMTAKRESEQAKN